MGIPKKYRYDISGIMGSGCAINVVTGARSFGKTYAWKKQGIKQFIKNGTTWGYLRTFDQEIKDLLADGPEAFFSDIMRNEEFPGYRFKMDGRKMMCGKILGVKTDKKGKETEQIEWKVMGQLLALTKAQSYKGKTVANMHLLVFDEFIRETRVPPYPQDAVNKLYSLWETLDRRENRVKIVMLANAADVINPYFAAWGVIPPELGCHKKVKVGESYIYVENAWNNKFAEYADDSEIGRLTAGSAYSDYAARNIFMNGGDKFIGDMPRRAKPWLNIRWMSQDYVVYLDLDRGQFIHVRRGHNDRAYRTMALTHDDQTPDVWVIQCNHPLLKTVVGMARLGNVTYENAAVRANFCNILMLCGFR